METTALAQSSSYRIAIMLPRFSLYGGVEQFGYRLASALADRGHHVDFICSRQETEAPVGVTVLPVGRYGFFRSLKLLWYLFRAEQLRKQGNYDLSISLGKNWQQDVTRMGGGPLRIFWEQSERAISSWPKRMLKRLMRWLSPVSWITLFVEYHQFNHASRVIAVSHLVRSWLLEAYPRLNPDNVDIVYNKPDLGRFSAPDAEQREQCRSILDAYIRPTQETVCQPSTSKFKEAPLYIGTASTNFVLKGVEPLIRAIALLPGSMHLFVAGGRANKRYMRLAYSLGVADRVHFCGKVGDMPSFYRALDLFILPTYYDACSNAVLEALASGCPAITTSSNGASFFLPPEQILPDAGDYKLMAKQIHKMLLHPNKQAFAWPAEVTSGIADFVGAIETLLKEKTVGK